MTADTKTAREIIAETNIGHNISLGHDFAHDIEKRLAEAGYEIRRKVRIADERAGPVLATVRNLFDLSPTWSASAIRDGVADSGIDASAKEVYNALGYMTRKGLIRRMNYGQYVRL